MSHCKKITLRPKINFNNDMKKKLKLKKLDQSEKSVKDIKCILIIHKYKKYTTLPTISLIKELIECEKKQLATKEKEGEKKTRVAIKLRSLLNIHDDGDITATRCPHIR